MTLSQEEISSRIQYLKSLAKAGADRVHDNAAIPARKERQAPDLSFTRERADKEKR